MPGRKVRLISGARHIYGGRPISPNEEFEADEKDAEDLIALNLAVAAPEDKPKRTYRRRDLKAEN